MTVVFPRGALAVFLVAWGFSSDHVAISFALSVLVEGIKLQNLRWDLSPKHFQNIADFTTVLFAVVAVYQFVQYGFHGIYGILGLLPLVIFPLVFAQRSSSSELFPMSALFLSLRKKITRGIAQEQWVSTELIFALSCLLGASTGESTGDAYFHTVLLCAALLLFFLRPQTVKLQSWFPALVLMLALAVLVRAGMELSYRQMESTMSYWFSQFKWSSVDPNRTRTAIGHIGRLKLSDRVVLRVKAPLSISLPLYIHEASYTKFNLGSWHSPEQAFVAIDRAANTNNYPLISTSSNDQPAKRNYRLEITARHSKDVSVQAFPIGSTNVEGNEIIELKKNALGTISLEAIPGQLRYFVDYSPGNFHAIDELRGQPAPIDAAVPESYREAFKNIALELGLEAMPRKAAVATIHRFFMDNFSYSLIGKGYYPGKKPLLDFLNNQRNGHCEYFATATTLLLRAAGIPARYVVGYLVDEYSALENAFIARARHAHAWSEAYVDGHWQLVDTTPPNWLALENDRVSNWQSIQDYFGWVGFHINRLQRIDRTDFNQKVIWLVPALLVWLMWRLRQKITTKESPQDRTGTAPGNAAGPEVMILLEALSQRGLVPEDGQTVREFLIKHRPNNMPSSRLERLISLYYKARFSMMTLSREENGELGEIVDMFIENLTHQSGVQPR